MSATSPTTAPSPTAALVFVAWAVAVAGILIADAGLLWVAVPSILAAVVAYRSGRPAKLWLVYVAVTVAITLAFVWTSALFTHAPPTTTTITG